MTRNYKITAKGVDVEGKAKTITREGADYHRIMKDIKEWAQLGWMVKVVLLGWQDGEYFNPEF